MKFRAPLVMFFSIISSVFCKTKISVFNTISRTRDTFHRRAFSDAHITQNVVIPRFNLANITDKSAD